MLCVAITNSYTAKQQSEELEQPKKERMKPEITEIQIVPVKPVNGLVGFASFVLNNQLYLGSIGIITRLEGGYRLVYPTKKVSDRNINIFHPIDKSFAQIIEQEIIKRFEEVMNNHDRHNRINA